MKKIFRILPILFFVFLVDRFMYLPGRMDGIWQYETGFHAGDSVAFNDIDIVSNLEIKIHSNRKTASFYLLGCYFGNLYLLEKESLDYTKYVALEEMDFL